MVLCVHRDDSFLSEYQVRIWYGGHLFLWSQTFYQSENNGAILTISQTIKIFMASYFEAECADLLINAREAIVLPPILEEKVHT